MEKMKATKYYVNAAVISSVVFLIGVLVGLQLNLLRSNRITEDIKDVRRGIENLELEFLFFNTIAKDGKCEFFSEEIEQLAVEADKLGRQLMMFEEDKMIDLPQYKDLKKDYTLVLLRYWLFSERVKTDCKRNLTTILYFYSKDCGIKCDNQGFILDYIKQKYKDRVLIFAIDRDIDLPIVKLVRRSFNVTSTPSLIINGKTYNKFMDRSSLEEIVCSFSR